MNHTINLLYQRCGAIACVWALHREATGEQELMMTIEWIYDDLKCISLFQKSSNNHQILTQREASEDVDVVLVEEEHDDEEATSDLDHIYK